MPIYSFPSIGNPSSASTRSVMFALCLVMLSLFAGFGVMYLIGLLGFNTNHLLWVPVLTTAPAVVFAMFAVVKEEARREAHFRDMSTLVSDALILVSGIELGERDIRRMVDGDVIDVDGGTLRVEEQQNGRSKIMTLLRDEYPEQHEKDEPQEKLHVHKATIESPATKPEVKPATQNTGTAIFPAQQKAPVTAPQKPEVAPDLASKNAKVGVSNVPTSNLAAIK